MFLAGLVFGFLWAALLVVVFLWWETRELKRITGMTPSECETEIRRAWRRNGL